MLKDVLSPAALRKDISLILVICRCAFSLPFLAGATDSTEAVEFDSYEQYLANYYIQYALWQECAHTFGDWISVTLPDCTQGGTEERICSACGQTERRNAEPKEHTEIIDQAVPATCTEPGFSEGSQYEGFQ